MACPFAGGGEDVKSATGHDALNYGSYLKIPQLLSLQELESAKEGRTPAHDEHLFIVIHQVYELWFKQILHEIESVREMFSKPFLEDRLMLCIVQRLERVNKIQKVLLSQVAVLETMTPLGFMEFRDYLSSSSGFQSVQFRLLENKLGVIAENRIQYHQEHYTTALGAAEKEQVMKAEAEPSLAELIEQWLARTPGVKASSDAGPELWGPLERNVGAWLADTRRQAESCTNPGQRALLLESCDNQEKVFKSLFDKDEHDMLVQTGNRRLSHAAFKGAMVIFLFREEPLFHLPFQMLQLLMDIDSELIKWRQAHAMLVQRTIGSKLGTGGSSGYLYLRATATDRYKVFLDFFNLSTFAVPREVIPQLAHSQLKELQSH